MAINIGIAVYFPVRSLSIFLLRLCSLLSFGFTTVFEHKSDIKENHFGMQFMREKVKLLNGSMAVDTGNTGTTVIVTIPIG